MSRYSTSLWVNSTNSDLEGGDFMSDAKLKEVIVRWDASKWDPNARPHYQGDPVALEEVAELEASLNGQEREAIRQLSGLDCETIKGAGGYVPALLRHERKREQVHGLERVSEETKGWQLRYSSRQ